MAVENKWVDTNVEAGKKGLPANIMPGKVFALAANFDIAAADTDASIYKVAQLNSNLVPLQIKINSDSSLGTSSISLGLYDEAGNAVDVDCFAAASDYTSGAAMGSELDGLTALPIEDIGKPLWKIASVVAAKSYTAAKHPDSFVLAFTAPTTGGAEGTISIRGLFIQG